MATSHNIESAEYLRLLELERQQDTIKGMLETVALPEVRTAYEESLRILGDSVLELAKSEELQASYATYGTEALQGLEQLSPLSGVLPEERLSELEQQLKGRIDAAREFFIKYGTNVEAAERFMALTPEGLSLVVTTEVDAVPEQEESELAEQRPEKSTEPGDITVTVGLGFARVGKSHKIIDYCLKNRADHHDYTEERRRALIRMLLLDEGEVIGARELFGAAFGDDVDFDGNKMAEIRGWFSKLTYYDDFLIQYTHNGRYFINPKFRPHIKYSKKLEQWLAGGAPTPSVEKDTTVAVTPEIVEPSKAALSDFYLLALSLKRFNFVLEDAGIGEITAEMMASLEPHSPDLSSLNGDEAATIGYRQRAFARVIDLLDDRDAFFEYIEDFDRESPEFSLMEFLYTLDENERDLIDLLIHAKLVAAGVTGRGQVSKLEQPRVETPDGEVIYPFAPNDKLFNRRLREAEQAATGPEVAEEPAPAVEEQLATVTVLATAPEIVGSASDVLVDGDTEEVTADLIETEGHPHKVLEKVEPIVDELIERLLATNLDPSKQYRRGTIEGATKGLLKKNNVANARENNVGPEARLGALFSLFDALLIELYSHKKVQQHFNRLRKEIETLAHGKFAAALEAKGLIAQTA